MTKYDLLDVIGTLDEKYLKEAEQRAQNKDNIDADEEENIMMTNTKETRKMPRYFGAAIAASLVLIAGTGVFLFSRGNDGLTSPAGNNVESTPIVTQMTGNAAVTNIDTHINHSNPNHDSSDPLDNVSNVFGGKGRIRILSSDTGNVLVEDSENTYYLSGNAKFTNEHSDNKYSYNRVALPHEMMLTNENSFSDGRELFYYSTDRKIYRLSYDGTKWAEYADLSNTDFVSENTNVCGVVSCGDYRVFVFENAMNLDILAREYACLYNHVTGEWTKLVDANGDKLHAASWHYDEQDTQFVVCQQSDGTTAQHDFLFYDLKAGSSKPVKSIRNVDTFDQNNGHSLLGESAFVGLETEWCVNDGTVYFKSLKNQIDDSKGVFELYKIHEGMTEAEKISDQVGSLMTFGGGYIYTNVNDKLIRYDLISMQPEDLLYNVWLKDIFYNHGAIVLTRTIPEKNIEDNILLYDIDVETALINGTLKDENLCFIGQLNFEESGTNPLPECARKRPTAD